MSGPATAASAIERLDDRLNPILVKEVRQALRGLYFKITFLFALFAAAAVGTVVLLVGQSEDVGTVGPIFFLSIFCCLAGAVHCFVPFLAFVSMSGEWDENTFDLLVLSNLKPRQIVLGKLLSAGTVALLYYSAFGPFLVMAFLLRGVDLVSILLLTAGSALYSLTLSALAIAVSTFARNRFLRVALMAGLAALLVFATGMSIAAAVELVEQPEILREPEAPLAVLGAVLMAVAVLAFAIATACSRIAHAEENRSTGLRAITVGAVLISIAWAVALAIQVGDAMIVVVPLTLMPFFLLVPFAFFATEPERLGRRVALHVPTGRLAAAVATPFLPGGGRGVLLFVFLALTALIAGVIGFAWRSPAYGVDGERLLGGVITSWAYGILYVALPTLLSSRWKETPRIRLRARLLYVLCFVGPLLIPSLVGFFLGIDSLLETRHFGNPFWAVFKSWGFVGGGLDMTLSFATVAALAVLVLSIPRLKRSIREVREASARRRERDAAAARPAGDSAFAVEKRTDAAPVA